MSEFTIPLRRVMLLQHTLESGGKTVCQMLRPERAFDAQLEIENDQRRHHIKASFGPLTASLTLLRGDSSKYQALRDFLQDLANGRTDSGRQSAEAIAMREALEAVNAVVGPSLSAYISPTNDLEKPFRVIVLNHLGEICAATKGHCQDDLAETVRNQIRGFDDAMAKYA
ncbi:hypothetical protein IAE35_05210 [Pseudomonas sp. S75]|uniref:hypothetical protein n=1 Tax=unclassified Pseudomonas TaxID=196821 RepID=UPI001907473B|nr:MULTISPECIES: hypothetical protein [unclassified Pseudomonas]MBJ9975295.1 hypothetical protein [Pseudomonas sp. S30]MBK0152731.1 hypothetical protein [Pseudomonas sp. S75]